VSLYLLSLGWLSTRVASTKIVTHVGCGPSFANGHKEDEEEESLYSSPSSPPLHEGEFLKWYSFLLVLIANKAPPRLARHFFCRRRRRRRVLSATAPAALTVLVLQQ
jgi:hypothetical protein